MEATIEVTTTRFGQPETVQVPESSVMTFPDGLPGFDDVRTFALIEEEDHLPFRWLQPTEDSSIAFILIDPTLVDPTYHPRIDLSSSRTDQPQHQPSPQSSPRGRGSYGRHECELTVLCIVAVRSENDITVNLRAPILIDRSRRVGKQEILTDDRYAIQHVVNSPGALAPGAMPRCS